MQYSQHPHKPNQFRRQSPPINGDFLAIGSVGTVAGHEVGVEAGKVGAFFGGGGDHDFGEQNVYLVIIILWRKGGKSEEKRVKREKKREKDKK